MKKIMITFFLMVGTVIASEQRPLKDYEIDQVRYRKRLSLSIGIPQVTSIKIRPSVEYRYKVKKISDAKKLREEN